MKTYIFYQKNSSAVMTISSNSFEEAEEELFSLVKEAYGWRCDDINGEEE